MNSTQPSDLLTDILANLQTKDEDLRCRASRDLVNFVATREITAEMTRLIQNCLKDLASSPQKSDKIICITTIDELIRNHLDSENPASWITPLANYLHICLGASDLTVITLSAKALGNLAHTSGTHTFGEHQLNSVIEWLQTGERVQAATLTLKELADENSLRSLFLLHMETLLEVIWTAFCDIKISVRECATNTLHSLLLLVAQAPQAQTWYNKLFVEIQKVIRRNTVEGTHGSFLVLGQLLDTSGNFLSTHFEDVWELVLKYKGSPDKTIYQCVNSLLPSLASFYKTQFENPNFYKVSFTHLLSLQFRRCPVTTISIGRLALVAESKVQTYLESICSHLKRQLAKPETSSIEISQSAIRCVGHLAQAHGPGLEPYLQSLLKLIFSFGLNPVLPLTLKDISEGSPSFRRTATKNLFQLLSLILCNKPFFPPFIAKKARQKLPNPLATGAAFGMQLLGHSESVILALQVLRDYDFGPSKEPTLIDIATDWLPKYLDDPNPVIRREAGITCCRLIKPGCIEDLGEGAGFHPLFSAVNSIFFKLVTISTADRDITVRKSLLQSFQSTPQFDTHLAQEENLQKLFLTLYDDSLDIRELAMILIGRLGKCNPALVMPPLRQILCQLLRDLELASQENTLDREESARLLVHLIHTRYEHLIRPYLETIFRALQPKLQHNSLAVLLPVLAAVGELAQVVGEDFQIFHQSLIPPLLDILDQRSIPKVEAVLKTLCVFVDGSGCVIEPYFFYPKLMEKILNEVKNGQNWSIRKYATKLLGNLGALDPGRYLRRTLLRVDEGKLNTGKKTDNLEELSVPPTSDEYYPTIAFNTLLRILRNPSLSTYHIRVIEAVVSTFRSSGLRCLPFMDKIMPSFLQAMKASKPKSRGFYFQQLPAFVSVFKRHIRSYLPEIFSLISEQWQASYISQIVLVVETIYHVMNDELRPFLSTVIAKMINHLVIEDKARVHLQTHIKILHCFKVLGDSLYDFLHLVMPALGKVIERGVDILGGGSDRTSSGGAISSTSAVIGGAPNPTPLLTPSSSSTTLANLIPASPSLPSLHSEAIHTLATLTLRFDVTLFTSNFLIPVIRLFECSPSERRDITELFCVIAWRLGPTFLAFHFWINRAFAETKYSNADFESVITALSQGLQFPDSLYERLNHKYNHPIDPLISNHTDSLATMPVNEQKLLKAFEASKQYSADDWMQWFRRAAQALMAESASAPLRACSSLGQVYPPIVYELFNATFASCYNHLSSDSQRYFIKNIKNVMVSQNLPPEILQALLNAAEFMELCEKPIPIAVKTLAKLSDDCKAFSKSLRFLENEFATSGPQPNVIESLIAVNDNLGQIDAALGILNFSQQKLKVELKESWYEKLQRWEDALVAYEERQAKLLQPDQTLALGQLRCLQALGQWQRLSKLCQQLWTQADPNIKSSVASFAARAALNLGHWEWIQHYLSAMDEDDGPFYSAIFYLYSGDFEKTQSNIDICRERLNNNLGALIGESYERSYRLVVTVQQLSELEEILDYKKATPSRQIAIKRAWNKRLEGCEKSVETWQSILSLRGMVVPAHEAVDTWVKFASLCRKNGRQNLARNTITSLLDHFAVVKQNLPLPSSLDDPLPVLDLTSPSSDPRVIYAYLKHLWATNFKSEAIQQLEGFLGNSKRREGLDGKHLSKCYLKLCSWKQSEGFGLSSPVEIDKLQQQLKEATVYDPKFYKAWHSWALFNYELAANKLWGNSSIHSAGNMKAVVEAVTAFFHSIGEAPSMQDTLQDLLRLLTLWFTYGGAKPVEAALIRGFDTVPVETWLHVIPQLIARLHIADDGIRKLLHQLLAKVGKAHPQALVYPLTVASKSQSPQRLAAAQHLINNIRGHSSTLIDQTLLVSDELIRAAILWRELWKEGLEESLKHYMDQNIDAMYKSLAPLIQLLTQGPETPNEETFKQTYFPELEKAWEFCLKYKMSHKVNHLGKAWDIFFQVLRKLKSLPPLTSVELHLVSPLLLKANNLEVAIPGTYEVGHEVVRIKRFHPVLSVFQTKQRPRKLTVEGSDGHDYVFLLKGHEDLRQDERVMQLFGLVNTLLARKHDFGSNYNIERYAVIPLSPNSGLAGWVEHCDTLHTLLVNYRNVHKVDVLLEQKKILEWTPKSSEQSYEALPLINRVEAFEIGLSSSSGNDLQKLLWLKSPNSEAWFFRRTNYTRSLAVMSMVGYILGLGDRHPNNIMLHRNTGKIIHIDFGDCFEVAVHRERYSEKIPFRLTRMLVNAMEVSGIEGNFRVTCNKVMNILRDNKESLIAMLEAFVHDPLINWRLLEINQHTESPSQIKQDPNLNELPSLLNLAMTGNFAGSMNPANNADNGSLGVIGESEPDPQAPQQVLATVIRRVIHKLSGRDFKTYLNGVKTDTPLTVPDQVQRLIEEATSSQNLCQSYSGWCPFW